MAGQSLQGEGNTVALSPPASQGKDREMNTEEEINKLWDAHFEVIRYLDELDDIVREELAYILKANIEDTRFIVNQMLKQGVNLLQIKKKIPQYELKQVYKELEEMQGKLEYTFSKMQELQKSTSKGKGKSKY